MTPRFDLVEIARVLSRRWRFVVIFTIAAAVVGGAAYMLQKKRYTASSEFMVANPQFADRGNVFYTSAFVDYFASEDDIDKVLAIAGSEAMRSQVIGNLNLYESYGLDKTDPKQAEKFDNIWNKYYDVRRTEYKNIEISFTDHDNNRAAAVANEAVKVTESIYREFYNSIKGRVRSSIQGKINELDSTINILTDSLAAIREQYKIYDIISPARSNIMSGSVKSSGVANFGYGLELLQNVEAVKDELVEDKARFVTTMAEFSTTTSLEDVNFVKVITPAFPPMKRSGIGGILTVAAAGIVGFFISIIIVLLTAYYQAVMAAAKES